MGYNSILQYPKLENVHFTVETPTQHHMNTPCLRQGMATSLPIVLSSMNAVLSQLSSQNDSPNSWVIPSSMGMTHSKEPAAL